MSWLVRIAIAVAPAEPAAAPIDVFEAHGPFIANLWELGMTGIVHRIEPGGSAGDSELTAGFDELDAAKQAAMSGQQYGLTTRIEPAVEDWGDGSATWVEVSTDRGRISFPIVAEAAFGHGGHPTTRLAIELMERADVRGHRLLDLGTGSGVLAIAAHHLGAAPIVAIDNDPRAIETADRNLAASGAPVTCLSVAAAEVETALSSQVGGVDLGGAAFDGRFDVVVANVLVTVHEEAATAVDRVLGTPGRLIVTGFLDHQQERVVEAYRARRPSLSVSDELEAEEWRALILTDEAPI